MTTVGVLRETAAGERRVALTPHGAGRLAKQGVHALVESGAGAAAFFPDEAYHAAGAMTATRHQVYSGSDVVVCVAPPDDAGSMRPGAMLVGLLGFAGHPESAGRLADAGVTAVSLELLPRTLSRAQAMDALS
ncbi:MAG: NAD(P) transhydrogenase subunit alpha, partial [Catenulispora sp.]